MKDKTKLILAGMIPFIAMFLVLPGVVLAFVINGESLGISTSGFGYQRDFRIRNDFEDASANNNTVEEAMFPGAVGAPLAIWRGANAWNSQNPRAAQNFDFDYQGLSTTSSGNENVVEGGYDSSGCGGSTLAFAELPSRNGWRIRFCEAWQWSDGPGSPAGSQVDIRGVAVHEFGHVLGLGHTTVGGCNSGTCDTRPTMCAMACSNETAARTIETDDQNGLNAIYGSIPSDKPVLTSLGGSTNIGGTLFLEGSAFGTQSFRVKFTTGTSSDFNPSGTVTVTPETTELARLTVPSSAETGNVLIWKHNTPRRLSNYLPITIGPTLSSDCYGQKAGTPTPGTNGSPTFDLLFGPSVTGNQFTEVQATGFQPNKTGFLLVSLTQSTVTWKSNTNLNVGFPLVIPLTVISSDSNGEVNLPFAILDAPDFFGTIFWLQLLIRDDAGVDGFATTEALGVELCDDMIP